MVKEKISFVKSIVTKYNRLKEFFTDEQLDFYFDRLPEEYFLFSNVNDIIIHLRSIPSILDGTKKKIEVDSDTEKFSIVDNDITLINKSIKFRYLKNKENPKLLQIYRDKKNKFFIIGSYDKLKQSGKNNDISLQEPDWKKLSVFDQKMNKKISFDHTYEDHSLITMELTNIAFFTLIRNLLETLDQENYSFIEIWMNKNYTRKIKTVYQVTIGFYEILPDDHFDSISEDFKRYIQKFLQPRSIFDIVDHPMVGPSSSHTAGACRIGQIARNLLLGLLESKKIKKIDTITVKLLDSYRDTGIGHYTPEAIIGGLSGLKPDDEEMIKRGLQAVENKETFRFEFNSMPVSFGGFIKGNLQDDQFYASEKNHNIAEIIATTDKRTISITGFSIGGGNVEIRYINRKKLSDIITGEQDIFLDYKALDVLERKKKGSVLVTAIDDNLSKKREHGQELEFNTFEELIECLGATNKSQKLVDHILTYEQQISGNPKAVTLKRICRYWEIMKNAILKGLNDNTLTKFGLTGADSDKINHFIKDNTINDNIYTKALRYAIAVNEINAKNGVIVTCPTAGSCGMLPGILKAWEETNLSLTETDKEEKIIEAILIAGFFGMILFDDVHPAGADLGCQAEIGGGAAMSAAALVHLENGTLEQMVEAFTLVLKNSMGLICDPVAGLVEVPCVKRNGLYSSMAISAATMALAGVKSFISADEVVLAVKEVGERMSEDYKETAHGGLAKTRDGKKVDQLVYETTQNFFKS